ncbi:hypothetical protein PYW07_014644 [Mythimna separata]|uniref:Uncharacterized protein n=1 Tax=Mythimna separata TaxID=271217 RepID=A0AAD8DZQ1_MYTSE|nr:hypothetical protein PYW07_014644 [Mythimna separata]
MLETDEVDDDFFTPVAGTSLANIFGNVSKTNEGKSNDSLKYVPPKPQSIIPKPETIKTTECIFACALIGHEWFNNVYTTRGKLGFAIVKIQKTSAHNIVLYDSNKTTLSCTTISPNLEVTIKNDTYISYYDNFRKYWSIYGTKEEVKKVAEHLTSFGVNINYSSYTDQGPPEPATVEINTDAIKLQNEKIDIGSDTDSSINRKTKASILNRMANMGHSVLPARTLPVEKTSDSSDTMETEAHPKSVRHKPVKNNIKKNNLENMSETQQIAESQQRTVLRQTESITNIPLYASHAGQLLPMTSTNLITGPSGEMGMFISEQRISNSELRINMNRITDKVDAVLDKINHFDQKGNTIQTDILMKLLTEYENKIKVYEELLKSRNDKNIEHLTSSANDKQVREVEILQSKISEYEKINQEKSKEVINLQEEIQLLKSKYAEDKLDHANNEAVLLTKISNYENSTKGKDEELADIRKKYEDLVTNTSDHNIGDKVKNIMNDTFQTISVNFDSDESYTGETVKKIIATVIKKITIQTLSELK